MRLQLAGENILQTNAGNLLIYAYLNCRAAINYCCTIMSANDRMIIERAFRG